MNYYVLHVKTNSEEIFIDKANRTLPDKEITQEFFFPKRKLVVRRRGKKIEEVKPIFPGYVFLGADEITPALYQALKRTKFFFKFLKNNHDVRPLSGSDLDVLAKFLSFGPVAEISKVTFDENDRIVVSGGGPLSGLEGSIIKVDKRKQRVKVRVDFSYQSFVFDLSYEVVEKLPLPDKAFA